MAKKPLTELQELAKPALRHAELVKLAETETPGKVFEIASSRWPRRQAKAARSLAMVRRDYGEKAFNAFLTTMERVRSEQSETEQAQEARQMKDRIKKALERLTDPKKKLEIMVSNGLIEEATAFLYETVNTMTAYFDWNPQSHNPNELFTMKVDPTSPLDEVKVGFHPADTDLARDRLNIDQDSVFSLDFRGTIKTLKWSDEETLRFAQHLLERMVNYPIYTHYFVWIVEGMQRAVRHFLPPENELARRVERWMILYRFRGGRIFELRQRALPVPMEASRTNKMTGYETQQELNPIVDRMLELGMSESEVRDEFLNWMREKSEQGCRPQFMLAVAGAKCFKRNDPDRQLLLREKYLSYMWEQLVQYNWVSDFAALGHVGLWKVTPRYSNESNGDEQFFRTGLTKLLVEGKAGKVFQLLVLLGDRLGVYSEEIVHLRDDWGNRPEVERAMKMMDVLAVDAFDQVFKAGQYGVAAALSQHFNCYDEKQLGREADQSVVDEVAQIMGDHIRSSSEYLADVIREGVATKDSDEETKANHAKLMAIRSRRNAKFEEIKAARKEQFREALQLAVDLEQPIRLEWMTLLTSIQVE